MYLSRLLDIATWPHLMPYFPLGSILTISFDDPNGGRISQEISLRGFVINPNIVTESIQPAVLYVPYSFLIQSDNHGVGGNTVTWHHVDTVNFPLPPGISLDSESGELYGMPTRAGVYAFRVRMSNSLDIPASYATFILEVLINSDANVDRETVDYYHGFMIERRLPPVIALPVLEDMAFVSVAQYPHIDEFVALWLNGVELVRDIDYYVDPGSTVITVRAQTFNEHDAIRYGRNTIAAEFRDSEGVMRRSAQNFYLRAPGALVPEIVEMQDTGSGPGFRQPGHALTSADGDSLYDSPTSPAPPAPAPAGVAPAAPPAQAEVEPQQGEGLTLAQFVSMFDDLSVNDWFINALFFMFQRDLMVGMGERLFGPNDTSSRAMLVTILHREVGSPDIGAGTFNDVDSGAWYADAVAWSQAGGIVAGTGNGLFSPGDSISRQDLATILYRFAVATNAELPDTVPFGGFTDQADVAGYAAHAIEYLFKAGIILGRPDGSFDPRGNATRAEMATMLQHFLQAIDQ
ncbi:MAG: S-layer homology domain-containing protein [Defluviitaleaceae bacterium]|nr:S-layer homology domain-containing protein [Defluviitaleaceae bacterium]